jgi:hypothetical protein
MAISNPSRDQLTNFTDTTLSPAKSGTLTAEKLSGNPMISEAELEEKVDAKEYSWRKARNEIEWIVREGFDENPPEEYSGSWRGMAKSLFTLGAARLALGEYEAARAAFGESVPLFTAGLLVTRMYRRQNRKLEPPRWFRKYYLEADYALHAALLSGDDRARRWILGELANHRDSDPVTTEEKALGARLMALAALLDGDHEATREWIERARRQNWDSYNQSLTLRLYEALLEDETAEIQSAIETIAADHVESVDRVNTGVDILSHHALGGLALARRQGLDVTVDSPAIPPVANRHDWGPTTHDLPDDFLEFATALQDYEFEEADGDDYADQLADDDRDRTYRVLAHSEDVAVEDREYPDLPLYQGGLTGPGYNFAMSVAEALFRDDRDRPEARATLERSDLHVPVSHFAAVADRLWVGATPEGLYVGTPLRPEAYGYALLSRADMAGFDCEHSGIAVVDADALADAVETVAREGESWAKLSLAPEDDELVVRSSGSGDLLTRTVEMEGPPSLTHDWAPGDAPFLYLLTDPTHRDPPAFAWAKFPTAGIEYARDCAVTDPFDGDPGDPLGVRVVLVRGDAEEDDGEDEGDDASWVGGLCLDTDPEKGPIEPGSELPGAVTIEGEGRVRSTRWPFGAPDRRASLLEAVLADRVDQDTRLESGDAVVLAESTYDGGRLQSFVEGHPPEPRRYIDDYLLSLATDDRLRIERRIREASHLVYEQAPLE